MSLNAHPYAVEAEVAWRRESLGRAGLAGKPGARRPLQLFRLSPLRRRARRGTPAPRRTPRAI